MSFSFRCNIRSILTVNIGDFFFLGKLVFFCERMRKERKKGGKKEGKLEIKKKVKIIS